MISVKHLSKTYHNADGSTVTVLKDVNCEISKGEAISVIGGSGTGKSTFLRCLNLLDTPSSGEIVFEGENILQKGYPVHKLRQRMGMVFQEFNLFEHMTVLENIVLVPRLVLGLNEEDARSDAMHLLRKVGLAEKADAMPSSLSGGQKQRVAIARALAMHPEVILFDEPTSALDPTMVGEVLSVIRDLAREGMTLLLVTHQLKFAREISDRIFYMQDGVIFEEGTPQQIFENPVHSSTKAFVRQIRRAVFEVGSPDFDFQGMYSSLAQFCHKYNVSEKMSCVKKLCNAMLDGPMATHYPMTVRLSHSELTEESFLDFMVEKLDVSPLSDASEEFMSGLRSLTADIIEESTSRGFRVRLIL